METKKLKRLVAYVLICLLFAGGCAVGERQPTVNPQQSPLRVSAAEQRKDPAPLGKGNGATTIQPGQSVGLLRIGDSRERALELFGKPEDDYNYEAAGGSCNHAEMHWYDVELDSNGLFVYLRNGRIYEVASATPRYATADAITNGSSPEDVHRNYPQARAYVLINSGSRIVGGRDIIYWVDRQKGIAFELYYNPRTSKRFVESVVVFEPETEFQPKGCNSSAQVWRELKPFALEPPGTHKNRR